MLIYYYYYFILLLIFNFDIQALELHTFTYTIYIIYRILLIFTTNYTIRKKICVL